MPIWVWIFIFSTGLLFGLKMTYVLCTALAVPVTQGALYVSTSKIRIASFFEAVPMQPGQLLVDLGCGDGRVLRHARKCFNVRTIGYEINLLAYIKAKVLSIGLKNVEIIWKDFWSADLSEADVVFCYLYPDVLPRLSRKLKADLKPGTIIVSCNFGLPKVKPFKVLRPGGCLNNDPLYVYRV
jgi:hypothetical protein